jgi:hypothetical protein
MYFGQFTARLQERERNHDDLRQPGARRVRADKIVGKGSGAAGKANSPQVKASKNKAKRLEPF